MYSGGSYGSSSDQRIHFGLGAATKVDSIEIDWPSGAKEKITVPGVDRIVTIQEGKSDRGEEQLEEEKQQGSKIRTSSVNRGGRVNGRSGRCHGWGRIGGRTCIAT